MSNLTKTQLKAITALQKAEQGAFKRAAAYIIIPPNLTGDLKYGTIRVAYPADGASRLNVFVWDCQNTGIQHGSATGYGYDKLSAALAGIVFDGIVFTNHPTNWRMQLQDAGYRVIQAL